MRAFTAIASVQMHVGGELGGSSTEIPYDMANALLVAVVLPPRACEYFGP
jgi:hypothetical protein